MKKKYVADNANSDLIYIQKLGNGHINQNFPDFLYNIALKEHSRFTKLSKILDSSKFLNK